MIEQIVNWLSVFPTPLATVLLSSIPILESRAAIPVAIELWGINPLNALALATIGNMLFIPVLLLGLERIRQFLAVIFPRAAKFLDFHIDRAHNQVKDSYARYGVLALAMFVATPFPLTGAYSATLAAVALKIPFRYALLGIFLGVLAASIMITVLVVTASGAFSRFN